MGFNPFKKSSWKSVGNSITHIAYQAGDAVKDTAYKAGDVAKDVGYQAGDITKGLTQQALALAGSLPIVGPLVNTGVGLVLSIPGAGPFLGKTLGLIPSDQMVEDAVNGKPLPPDATLEQKLEYWLATQDPVMQQVIVYGGLALVLFIFIKVLMKLINIII